VADADPVQAAIAREKARRDREAAAAAAGSAGGAGADRYQEGYDHATYDPVAEALAREQQRRDAAGGSHKGGSQSELAANGGPGGSKGKGAAGSGDAGSDPVKRALARAESQSGAAGAGNAGAAGQGGANGGRSGAGQGGAGGNQSAALGGSGVPGDDSPVSEALRRAEAAAAAARERERQEAEARRGRVETAANRVLIDQDERLQTLDGMLPMALNMDEQGLFDFDRYQLRDDVKRSLDDLAEKLKSAAYDKLHILGFTDRIGTEEYNRRLSEKRAWAVAGYLMNKGVPPHKLRVVGRGEEDSVVGVEQCDGLSREEMIECLQKDRRVEIAATVKEYQLDVR
jgi:outer membrane protein OmpA-like peptidoglycan-associated protein